MNSIKPSHKQLPGTWKLPSEFRGRIGSTAGRQRAMQSGGHLLLVLHAVPEADEASRRGRFFWRNAAGKWHSSDFGDGPASLHKHLDQYSQALIAMEELETRVVANASPTMLDKINRAKRNLLVLRRGIWPQRDALNVLIRDPSQFVTDETKVFLRDCHDHCTQVADVLETFRETAGALLSTYLSALGNKQNEVMRVLTIMSSIFIPLTFMAGIYGMNFEAMPELKNPMAYPLLLAVMICTVIGMLVYFKRLGWIWTKSRDD